MKKQNVVKEAREHLSVLCKDFDKFKMCIPAREDDSDMILSRAFDHAEKLEMVLDDAVRTFGLLVKYSESPSSAENKLIGRFLEKHKDLIKP